MEHNLDNFKIVFLWKIKFEWAGTRNISIIMVMCVKNAENFEFLGKTRRSRHIFLLLLSDTGVYSIVFSDLPITSPWNRSLSCLCPNKSIVFGVSVDFWIFRRRDILLYLVFRRPLIILFIMVSVIDYTLIVP